MRSLFFFAALLIFAAPAQAEVINLSCDEGGMLLTINTDAGTITDNNPFQKIRVTVKLAVTDAAYSWREDAAEYVLDRKTNKVSGMADGKAIDFSNPQCGRSATPRAK